jgi:signal transduction histidine kinase
MRSILERPSMNLLVLGTLFAAYTGRRTFQSRRREAFLGEVNGIANLRLSAEEALVEKLHRLCDFFAARECILLCTSSDSSGYLVYRVRGNGESAAQAATRLSDAAARALLELPDGLATAWSGRQTEGGRLGAACRRLANLLEAPSFATVPYTRDQQIVGRIFLVAERSRFTRRDLGLLTEVVEQVNAVVDFHAALDELKRGAARAERSRLSRDIHDTTIQPFLGLKFGIEALYRGLDPGSPVAQQVKQLLDFSSTSVEDLRNYAAHLRGGDGVPREQALPTKLQTQAERYRAFWGIEVDLRIAPDPPVSGELAAEAYQMACEALSNVRRHTQARRAFVAVRCDGACVLLEVGNERSADNPARPFTPRSIADRASALGGRVDVMLDAQGHDVVQVSLPMQAKR